MKTRFKTQRLQSGMTLIELMIAMTIGLILIGGALYVYSSARTAYTTNENYALMQENARFALSVLEPDVQLAGYFGQHRDPTEITGSAKNRERAGTTLAGIGNDCADNWVVRFDQHIEGYNNVDTSFNAWSCIDVDNLTVGSDLFAIRRVEGAPAAALNAGQLYMRSSEKPLGEVFLGNNEPTSLPNSAENFALVANAYYVRPGTAASADQPGATQPALRRVALTTVGTVPTMLDNEVTTGIEDMQIQYGIGPANVTGARGGVNVYVSDIENLLPPNNIVRSMRIWLLMRAERQEFDYIDDKEYLLGDKIIPARNDNYRRLVVSRTIFFRNLH